MSDVAVEVRYGTAAGRWVILATVLGSGMAAIDATVVGIALPSIGRDFHASLEELQWVVTSYTLTLAALLLLGGSLGDRLGRRRVFIVGRRVVLRRVGPLRARLGSDGADRDAIAPGRGGGTADAGQPGDPPGLVRRG